MASPIHKIRRDINLPGEPNLIAGVGRLQTEAFLESLRQGELTNQKKRTLGFTFLGDGQQICQQWRGLCGRRL